MADLKGAFYYLFDILNANIEVRLKLFFKRKSLFILLFKISHYWISFFYNKTSTYVHQILCNLGELVRNTCMYVVKFCYYFNHNFDIVTLQNLDAKNKR